MTGQNPLRTLIWCGLAKKSRALTGASLRIYDSEVTRRVVSQSEIDANFLACGSRLERCSGNFSLGEQQRRAVF